MDLVAHLEKKEKLEKCIPVLLNIIEIDRNFKERSAHNKIV